MLKKFLMLSVVTASLLSFTSCSKAEKVVDDACSNPADFKIGVPYHVEEKQVSELDDCQWYFTKVEEGGDVKFIMHKHNVQDDENAKPEQMVEAIVFDLID